MSSRKSYTQKQRDKRIQKQVENLGGPKKITKPKTLKKALGEAYERANVIERFPFSSGDKGSMLDMAGYKPASSEEKKTALLKGTTGLFKENVPKQLRDRLKEEKVQKKKDGGSVRKQNIDLIVAFEEGKKKRRQMKERTGNPKVDKLMEEFEDVKGYKFGDNIGKKAGGEIAKPKKRPKKDPFRADKTEIINEEFSKKVAKQNAKKMEKGGEAVPSKYKGFSKLPEKVQQKINPNLASKYEYGGSVKGKGGKMMCRGQGAAIKGGGFSIR